jgi:2-iminobutanoate/2-iminopropanoate deaminase
MGVAAALLIAGCASDAKDLVHRPMADAKGPYSGSVTSGDYCFISGKIGVPDGPFEQEAAGAIAALEAELRRNGLKLRHLVQVTVYLTDMELYGPFNEIYAERLPAPYPARACVAVTALPAGARVEISAIARRERWP